MSRCITIKPRSVIGPVMPPMQLSLEKEQDGTRKNANEKMCLKFLSLNHRTVRCRSKPFAGEASRTGSRTLGLHLPQRASHPGLHKILDLDMAKSVHHQFPPSLKNPGFPGLSKQLARIWGLSARHSVTKILREPL